MLKRKMYDTLDDWRQAGARKVFILLGARQTGKTFIVRDFAEHNYEAFLEVNFLEDEESGRFLAAAENADDLMSRLSLIAGAPLQKGMLVFFDEVQHLGHGIVTLSKFLVEDGRFDLVLSGSLLGTALEGVTSFPVGSARIERMYPLDFEEFCWALGVPDSILETVQECYEQKTPVEETLHDRLVKLFRHYIVVGGMPEAVQGFLDHDRELGEARKVDADIIEQYRYDIVKYAKKRQAKILAIFDNVPAQLAKENKRFVLKSMGKGSMYDNLEDDFSWLTKAGVVLPTNLVTEPKRPLLRTEVPNKFKLYALDCGLLLAQFPPTSAKDIVAGEGDGNYGAVYENVAAQQLASAGFPLFYYNNNRKGEVDFLLETAEGKVLPVEVKSGKDYKLHSALNNMLRTEEYGIETAYVLSEYNVSVEQREGKPVYYLPLYMTMCFARERDDDMASITLEDISFES